MRAVAFAIGLLVLESSGVAAEEVNLNPWDAAAVGGGAMLGFFGGGLAIPALVGAEVLSIPGYVGAYMGTVVGGIAGAWWYSDHDKQTRQVEIRPMTAQAAVALQGETPTLVIRHIPRVY